MPGSTKGEGGGGTSYVRHITTKNDAGIHDVAVKVLPVIRCLSKQIAARHKTAGTSVRPSLLGDIINTEYEIERGGLILVQKCNHRP